MVRAKFSVVLAITLVSMAAGCAGTSQRPPTVPPDDGDYATLPGNYPRYCLATSTDNESTRATILAVPSDYPSGWPTEMDVTVKKPTNGPVPQFWACDDGGYFDNAAKISISDDGNQRWLHFTFDYGNGTTRTEHHKIFPHRVGDNSTPVIWYQSEEVNPGLQFFVYMTAAEYDNNKYIQNYRVEIFSQPNTPSCLAERPSLTSTVSSEPNTGCPGIILRQNGVGAGNEPRRP